MIVYDGPGDKGKLPDLLEGYLHGLGEVCHQLFGKEGEVVMYSAIGSYFLNFLKQKLGIEFTQTDPWERYCRIIKVFTDYGFYSHVELEELENNTYWMLETDQYAGDVWEEQGAWERGTPPCPLWSIILHSLSGINQTIILDSVSYNKDCNGYESTFHFEKIPAAEHDVITTAKETLRAVLLPICSFCHKIRNENGEWIAFETYFEANSKTRFSHGVCRDCAEKHYPGMGAYDK